MGKNKKKGNKKKNNHGSNAISIENDTGFNNDNNLDDASLIDTNELSDVNNINKGNSLGNTTQIDYEQVEELEKEEDNEVINNDKTSKTENSNNSSDYTVTETITKTEGTDEIIYLRKEIEVLQNQLNEYQKNNSNDSNLIKELEKVKNERDTFENQYNTLLSKISSMKNVFHKMKESQQELETVQERLTEYESQNTKMKSKLVSMTKQNEEFVHTITTLNKELSNLENDYEALQNKCDEYENAINEYEMKLEDKATMNSYQIKEYESKVNQLNTEIEEMKVVIGNNKRDLKDLKDEKEELITYLENSKKNEEQLNGTINELKITVQNNEKTFKDEIKCKDQQLKSLRIQLDSTIDNEKGHLEEIKTLRSEIDKLNEVTKLKDKFEQESKEQALQIGKLRQEAIILNEHLRKALGMLKQSSESETVDKELISNLLVSFVSIPRADPKKFEVLQLLSNFLNWDDEKKQQAGLINNPNKSQKKNGPVSKTQSFVSLWTDFLEKESEI